MERICRENALNIPNALTLFRIALMPVLAWYYRLGNMRGALIVYLTAMLSDVADGVIARRYGQITALGKLLDPIADKVSLLTILLLFSADGQIPAWLVNVVILKEAILILGSAAALREGIVVSAMPIGKVTTLSFVLATTARLLGLRTVADILLWCSVALSLAALVWYASAFVRNLHARKAIA